MLLLLLLMSNSSAQLLLVQFSQPASGPVETISCNVSLSVFWSFACCGMDSSGQRPYLQTKKSFFGGMELLLYLKQNKNFSGDLI